MWRRPSQLLRDVRSVAEVARLRPFDTSTPDGRSKERYRRIVLSSAVSVAGRLLAALASLVAVPVAIAALGKERYGLWAAVSALAPWTALLDLGLVAGLVNAVAEAHGRDDDEGARSLFSTAFFALCAITAFAALVGLVAVPRVRWDQLYGVPSALAGDARLGTAVALGLALLAVPFNLVPQVYNAYQRNYLATAFATLGAVVSVALLVAAARLGGSVPWVAAATTSAALLSGIASFGYLARRGLPWMAPSLRVVRWASLRRLLASSVPLYLFQIGALLVNQTQQLVLARRADLSTVAEYDLLMKMYVLATGLITLSTASFAPTFREASERGDVPWMRSSFWHLVRVRMALGVLAGAGLLAFGNLALRVWLRRLDFQHPPQVWIGLVACLLVAVWASSFAELLSVLDRVWPQVWMVLAQGLLTVAITWALAARAGVLGAVLGLALPGIALSGWVLPVLARRVLAAPRPAGPVGGSPPRGCETT
jgi:O-antigen/teichoic acid export membrane protein